MPQHYEGKLADPPIGKRQVSANFLQEIGSVAVSPVDDFIGYWLQS